MIGKLLGHTQAQTTARYAHLASDPVKQAATRIPDRLASALFGAVDEPNARKAVHSRSLIDNDGDDAEAARIFALGASLPNRRRFTQQNYRMMREELLKIVLLDAGQAVPDVPKPLAKDHVKAPKDLRP